MLKPRLLGGRSVCRPSHDPYRRVALSAYLEIQRYTGRSGELVDDGRDQAGVVVTSHAAEQCEGNAVDNGGLARPRRPHERSQLHAFEVHLRFLAEGPKALHAQLQRSHDAESPRWSACCASSSSVNSARTRSSLMLRSARNSSNCSIGVRPARDGRWGAGRDVSSTRTSTTPSPSISRTVSPKPARRGSRTITRNQGSSCCCSPATSISANVPLAVRNGLPLDSCSAVTVEGKPGTMSTRFTCLSWSRSPKSSCSGDPQWWIFRPDPGRWGPGPGDPRSRPGSPARPGRRAGGP